MGEAILCGASWRWPWCFSRFMLAIVLRSAPHASPPPRHCRSHSDALLVWGLSLIFSSLFCNGYLPSHDFRWMLIVWPKISHMPQKISAQNVYPSPKVSNFWKKALSRCPLSANKLRIEVRTFHNSIFIDPKSSFETNQNKLKTKIL